MFNVEVRVGGEWRTASSHTQRVDAEAQLQRYIASGYSAEDVRLVEPQE